MKKSLIFAFVFAFVLGLDLFSKAIVIKNIQIGQGIPIVEGFFNLVHIRNKGVAFGLFAKESVSWALPYLNILILIGLALYLLKVGPTNTPGLVSYALILGGAFGNLIDRLRFGEVVDFLDFYIGQYHWPAFNVADSAVSIGVIILAYLLLNKRNPTKA